MLCEKALKVNNSCWIFLFLYGEKISLLRGLAKTKATIRAVPEIRRAEEIDANKGINFFFFGSVAIFLEASYFLKISSLLVWIS